MKKLLSFLVVGFLLSTASAAAVDWQLSVDETFANKYASANAYTYIVYSENSIATLVDNWRNSTWNDSALLTMAGAQGQKKDELASLSGWNTFDGGYNFVSSASSSATSDVNAYLVLILATGADDENAIYSYTTGLAFREDNVGSSEYSNFSELGAADANWDMTQPWTEVPVPEPTALALLALGVAGLALRRRA